MVARLTSRFLVDLILRRAQNDGGFAVILHKGDEHSGAIIVQCCDRGASGALMERRWSMDGDMLWHAIGPSPDAPESDQKAYLNKRINSDPDIWIVELDIANAAQLVVTWLSNA